MNEDHPEPTPQPAPPPVAPGGDHDEEASSKKILCGIMAIIFGSLGIHKFILGYTAPAVIMLACTLGGYVLSFLCFPLLLPTAMGIIGIIEGIIYLTKPAPEFRRLYMDGKKEWF